MRCQDHQCGRLGAELDAVLQTDLTCRSSCPPINVTIRRSAETIYSACRAAPKQIANKRDVTSRVLPMEVAMVADEGAFIGGVALTMTAITLLVSSLNAAAGSPWH